MELTFSEDVVRRARTYHDLGFALVWLKPRAKRPAEMAWAQGPRKPWKQVKEGYKPGMNIGVRLGTPSKLAGGFLACIDVDIRGPEYKEPAEQAMLAAIQAFGAQDPQDFAQVRSGGGSGSRHLYFTSDKPFAQMTFGKEKGCWEVVAYSDGRQMVLPPSIHPDTGKRYHWLSGGLEDHNLPALQVPDSAPRSSFKKEATAGGFVEIEGASFLKEELSAQMRRLLETGDAPDRSAALVPVTRALISVGATKDEILTILTDPAMGLSQCAYDHVQCQDRQKAAEWLWKYTVERLISEYRAPTVFKPVGEGGAVESPKLEGQALESQNLEFGEESWKNSLHRGRDGALKGDITNIRVLLENLVGPRLFVRNEFSNSVLYGENTFWRKRRGDHVSDEDIHVIQDWLCGKFDINVPPNLIWAAVIVIAHENRFHPVRDYLNSLEWDGKERIDSWLKTYLGADMEEPYLTEVSRKFLLAAVARIFQPGIKFDHIMVLEGAQGIGKSTAPAILASPRWFTSGLPNIRDKDALITLQGTWWVEISELATLRRVDTESYKAFFSASVDRFRVPYGKVTEEFPRQCVFVGTTNHSDYLSDNTGNRRFWPVKVKQCDFKKLSRDRDQLWAEATAHWKMFGEDLFLTGQALAQVSGVQEDRVADNEETLMQAALREFLTHQLELPPEERFPLHSFRLQMLFDVGGPLSRFPARNYALQLAGRALKSLYFERYKSSGLIKWRLPMPRLRDLSTGINDSRPATDAALGLK